MVHSIIAILIIVSIIIYVLSFFKHSKIDTLEKQVEHISLSMVQETYQLKKQIKVLQEELMIQPFPPVQKESEYKRDQLFIIDKALPISQQIIQLQKNGYTMQEIAKHTSLPLEEVRLIIQQQKWGSHSS